jgi:hypothetical protein
MARDLARGSAASGLMVHIGTIEFFVFLPLAILLLLWLVPLASYASPLIVGEHRLRDIFLGRADNLQWIDLALAWSAYLLTLPAGRGADAIDQRGIAHDNH